MYRTIVYCKNEDAEILTLQEVVDNRVNSMSFFDSYNNIYSGILFVHQHIISIELDLIKKIVLFGIFERQIHKIS